MIKMFVLLHAFKTRLILRERENRYTLKWFHNFWILFSHFNSENSSIRLTYFNKMLQIVIVCLDFARQNMIVMISKYNKVETKLLPDQGSMAFTLSTTAWTITANNKETYNVMLTRKATSPSHLFLAYQRSWWRFEQSEKIHFMCFCWLW